ncbi:hypothetical protein JNK13_10320, partial [bacterium]|nr:hypothetical protein [bacterium]
FNEGGYLMYRYMDAQARPRRLVSIDGRTNVGDQSVLKAFQSAWAGNYRWREYINLINPQTIIWPTRYPLTSILFAGQEWCRVYHDEDRDQGFSVFVRREYFLGGQSKLQSDNCV